jgi:hypothetical protein
MHDRGRAEERIRRCRCAVVWVDRHGPASAFWVVGRWLETGLLVGWLHVDEHRHWGPCYGNARLEPRVQHSERVNQRSVRQPCDRAKSVSPVTRAARRAGGRRSDTARAHMASGLWVVGRWYETGLLPGLFHVDGHSRDTNKITPKKA